MSWLIPLADVALTRADIDAVTAAYDSGWLSMGPRTQQFETEFAAYLGVRHAVAVSSGTAALHLMYAACELGPGDEAIVPSMTFVATAAPLRHLGATPVFADIAGEREPWLDPAAVEAAVGPATRAIVHMPYGGHPGELEALCALADRHGLLLLQDAAHAIGARVGERHVGAFGDCAAFSFFSNKNLAIGEGGMVATDDDAIAERVRRLRSHGMATLSWDRQRGRTASYDIERLGFNYRLDDPRSALGLSRLARLDTDGGVGAAAARRRVVRAPPLHDPGRRERPRRRAQARRRARRPDERALPAGPSLQCVPRPEDLLARDRPLRRADADPPVVRAYDRGAAAPRRRIGRRRARDGLTARAPARRRRWIAPVLRSTETAQRSRTGTGVHASTRRFAASDARCT
jgi:hypothetical protein